MIKQRKFDAIQPVTVKLQSEIFKAFFLKLQTLRLNELIINRAGDIQLFVIPFLAYKGGGSVNSQLYQPQLIRGLDWRPLCPWTPCFKQDSVATKILCNGPIIGQEPVSIIHYTRSGSSIKLPTPN